MRTALLLALVAAVVGAAIYWNQQEKPSPLQVESDSADASPASDAQNSPNSLGPRRQLDRGEITSGDSAPWRDLVRTWLFEVEAGDEEIELQKGMRNSPAAISLVILQELFDDANATPPRLRRDTAVARMLSGYTDVDADVASAASRYKRLAGGGAKHRIIKLMLAFWPCSTGDDCADVLADALRGLSDDDAWKLLRDRLLRDPSFRDRLLDAVAAMVSDTKPELHKATLALNAVLAFAHDTQEAVDAVHTSVLGLGDQYLKGLSNEARHRQIQYGHWTGALQTWALAWMQAMTQESPYADALDLASKQRVLQDILQGEWPDDLKDANVLQRVYLEVATRLEDKDAQAFRESLLMRTRVPGVRDSVLPMYGLSATVPEIQDLMGQVLTARGEKFVDSNMQKAYFVAIDNARRVNPEMNREAASAAFAEALVDDNMPRRVRICILESLEAVPMPNILWAVQQVANRSRDEWIASKAEALVKKWR